MKRFIEKMRVMEEEKGRIKLVLLWSEWFNTWEIVRREQFNVLHKKLRLVYYINYKSKKTI